MKFKKLLVLSMLSLMGTSAWAAVPEGVWTMPEPQGLEFTTFTDDGERYILYHPATKMFFSSGNGWNTMASLRTFGMELWLQEATESDAPEGSYELWDENVNNPERTTGTGNIFTDDGNASWVDHGTQGNYSWSYEIVGDCVRFANVALIADKPAFAGMYLGWDGTYVTADNTANSGDHRNAYTAILRHVDPAAPGASVDFKAVTVDSYQAFIESDGYQAYVDGTKNYIASIGLKETIEAAEANYVDAAIAIVVYSNPESTAADMAKIQASLTELIDAKKKLKAAIDDYESKGYTSADAAKAVFTNLQATKADIDKAKEDLDAAFIEWGKNQASVEKPVDMTSKIVNPHFDNGNATTGWSGDAFGRGGTVSDGAEHYSKNYDTYQTITGLAPGVYAIGVYGYYRSGNYGGDAENHWLANDDASKYAKLYGKVGDTYYEVPIANVMSGAQAENQGAGDIEVTYTDADGNDVVAYVPNTMATGDYYFHNINQYANKLYVAVGETGELTIGVKKTSQIGGDWSMFDDFSLTYYGSGADAAKLYLDETLKNYSDYTPEEGTIFTQSYLDAYKAAYSGDKTAENLDGAMAIVNGIDETFKAFEKNVELWQQWKDLVDQVKVKYVIDDQYAGIEPEIDDLADYVDDITVEEILDETEWTNEELQAEMDKVNQWVKDLVDKSKLDVWDGKNMTSYIVNPTFETSTTKNTGTSQGWTVDRINGGNVTPGPINGDGDTFLEKCGYYNGCFESWHCHKWDVWQEITGLPVGMYELEVQGYVRCEVGGYNKGDELGEDYPSPVYLYMNNAMSQFPSVYSEIPAENGITEFQIVESWTQEEINGNYFPNSMGGAAQCFHIDKEAGLDGMYKTTAYGLIAKEGDTFRIGVKMDANQDWWCIWDNFKLTYREPKADIVKPVLEEALKTIDTSKAMGKDIFAQADEVKSKAAEALAGTNGKAMFDVLTQVYDLTGDIRASVDKFAKLSAANQNLENATFDSQSAAVGEAKALANTINGGIENHSIEDSEVDGLIEQIDLMLTKLNMPDDMAQATDNDPKECTGVIKTPGFEDADWNNSAAGWTNPGNLGNDDTQKGVYAIEFWQTNFDMYQTIKGLPKGTYLLTVDAWCRVGDNQQNYDAWVADNAATMAYVYAVDGDSTVYSAPVANVMKGAMTESYGYDGEAEFTVGDVTYYMPGSLVSGRSYMDAPNEGVYTNSVICKVGDDGQLTIGIKKDQNVSNSWVVCDNFKLYYYGDGSSQQPSGDASSVNAVATAPVKVEFFSLSGARISKPVKGVVIQKQILGDGSVKVQKVTVK